MPNSDGKVHYSSLKQMEQSPAHYRWATTHERADSTAMRQGRALHALYLQGIEPVMLTGKRKPTDHADHLAPAEYDAVKRMFDALQADSHAKEILSRCPEREVAIEWDLMGMRCAGRVDLRGCGILADLKSCRAAHPKKFLWDAVLKALSADAEAVLKAKEFELSHQAAMLQITTQAETRLYEIEVEDRKSARASQVGGQSKVPAILAGLVTCGFFGVLIGMMTGELKSNDNQALLLLLGSLATAWGATINYTTSAAPRTAGARPR